MRSIESLPPFRIRTGVLCLLFVVSWWPYVFSAESPKPDRIRMGYSSISGSRIALWATKEMGFFSRHGLQAEIIVIPGIQGMQSLIAGDIQFFLGATDTAAQATARGSYLVVLATAEPIRYNLIVQPGIKTVEDLKGKKVVVDRVGGTSYNISLRLLEKVGLKPGDVEFIQVSGGGAQRVAAFKSGVISAVVTSTERFEELKIPYHVLADAAEMGLKMMGNSYITTRAYRDRNRDLLQRTVRGLIEGRSWIKNPNNRDGVFRIYSRYLRTNDARVLDLYYRIHVEPIPLFPYTNIDHLREFLNYSPEGVRALRELNLSEFVDNSFIRRVEKEGLTQ